jgi:hypothetical protein
MPVRRQVTIGTPRKTQRRNRVPHGGRLASLKRTSSSLSRAWALPGRPMCRFPRRPAAPCARTSGAMSAIRAGRSRLKWSSCSPAAGNSKAGKPFSRHHRSEDSGSKPKIRPVPKRRPALLAAGARPVAKKVSRKTVGRQPKEFTKSQLESNVG